MSDVTTVCIHTRSAGIKADVIYRARTHDSADKKLLRMHARITLMEHNE